MAARAARGTSVTATPRPHPDVVSRRVGDETVLVNLKTNRIYSLNRTGARLWELLGEGKDRAAAEEALLGEFDVDETELRREVDDLLGELEAEDLVL
jgi:coenzyme PQQ synthesis protein D (PqqD)